EMAGVKRSHGRHEGEAAAERRPCARQFFTRTNNLHRRAPSVNLYGGAAFRCRWGKDQAMNQPHFIVFANEKGGTGKSTTAVHTAIALAASGHRVGALDLDSRQRTMTRYLENRDATMRRLGKDLPQATYAVLEDLKEEQLTAAIDAL